MLKKDKPEQLVLEGVAPAKVLTRWQRFVRWLYPYEPLQYPPAPFAVKDAMVTYVNVDFNLSGLWRVLLSRRILVEVRYSMVDVVPEHTEISATTILPPKSWRKD